MIHMKKICLLLLICCPMLLVAQEKIEDSTPKLRKRELAVSPAPFLSFVGIRPQNQPFFVEYKQLIGKRYLRLGLETYTSQTDNGTLRNVVVKDSILVINNSTTTKSNGFLKIGIERQRVLKYHPKLRLRTGVDALVGSQSESLVGSYAELNMKTNKLTSKDYNTKDFESRNYFQTGIAAFAGLDYLLGARTYLGMNVSLNFTYTPQKAAPTNLDMRISPYLAWKF